MTDLTIRPARRDEIDVLLDLSRRSVGDDDYLPLVLHRWLDDPRPQRFLLAEGPEGPVGMTRVSLLTPSEGWIQGTRVAKDHQRRGVGRRLTEEATRWAADHGASVVRLAVMGGDRAGERHVAAARYRPVGNWVVAQREIGDASPLPRGNGGRRVPALEQLRKAHSSEAEPAFLSWSSGELARTARGLLAVGWTWRRLGLDDLVAAGRAGALFQARSGWAMAAPRASAVVEGRSILEVGWLETGPDDAADFARALVDLATTLDTERVRVMAPDVPWLTQALRRARFSTQDVMLFARPAAP